MSSSQNEKLFSGSLTFLSILLAVFTFALASAMRVKGTYPEAYPWLALAWITGGSILLNTAICIFSFFHVPSSANETLNQRIAVLFVLVVAMCGIGIPLLGLWIYAI